MIFYRPVVDQVVDRLHGDVFADVAGYFQTYWTGPPSNI